MKAILRTLALSLVLVSGDAALAGTPPATCCTFNIPAGRLNDSMEKFAATIGGDVVFDSFAAHDAQTRPVQGQMSPESALSQMFSGTELSYTYNAAAKRVIVSSRKQ